MQKSKDLFAKISAMLYNIIEVIQVLDKKWYNEDDLSIFYYYNDNPKDIKTKNYLDKNFFEGGSYKIVYLISGDRIFEIGNKRIKASNGMLAIAPPNERIGFERTSNKTNCYMYISIHPKIFDDLTGDNEFLRVFQNTDDESKVFNIMKFDSLAVLDLLDSIYQALKKHLGRIHILPKILSIISELDIVYDEADKSNFKGSDNYDVNLMGYINRNFTEKINLNDICEKFFISKTTVNKIVKKNTGMTFLKYIDFLRVNEANRLMKSTAIPISRIYKLAGFSDYSTFFRQYKKSFGIPPANKERPHVK